MIPETRPSLAAEGLALERGERLLFSGLAFSAQAGTLLRLAGANGTGKTSLLRVIAGLLQPLEGSVLYRGEPAGSLGVDFFSDLVYIGHMNGVKDDLSAAENLIVNARLGNITVRRDDALEALDRVGIRSYADTPAGELSQGQRRRSALARLFVSAEKPLWLLDEPFTALDRASVTSLSAAIAAHVRTGGIVVYTTHQEEPVDVPPEMSRTLDLAEFAPAEWDREGG